MTQTCLPLTSNLPLHHNINHYFLLQTLPIRGKHLQMDFFPLLQKRNESTELNSLELMVVSSSPTQLKECQEGEVEEAEEVMVEVVEEVEEAEMGCPINHNYNNLVGSVWGQIQWRGTWWSQLLTPFIWHCQKEG
jgi:hypothetical protein